MWLARPYGCVVTPLICLTTRAKTRPVASFVSALISSDPESPGIATGVNRIWLQTMIAGERGAQRYNVQKLVEKILPVSVQPEEHPQNRTLS